jgi:transposase-like protein
MCDNLDMPPVDRNNPKRAASSDSRMSLMEFMQEFPNDAACLDWLWRTRYSEDGTHAYCPSVSCKRERTFKRYETAQRRQSWTCTACGTHIHPTAGTIFHKSSTSLHLWFYAIYVMTSTRCGISAKQMERELGVTYKTAWRMMHLIRNKLMAQDEDTPLSGDVEVDETYVGGRPRANRKMDKAHHQARKAAVMGAVERGGKVRATVMPQPTISGPEARAVVTELVKADSRLYTDESVLYHGSARRGYEHHTIEHKAQVYARGNVHTQTIEGFFSTLKNGIRGAHHAVSHKHLQGYLNEYVWRYNHRDDDLEMFRGLILRAALTD